MEHASKRDTVVESVMALLKKKRILLLWGVWWKKSFKSCHRRSKSRFWFGLGPVYSAFCCWSLWHCYIGIYTCAYPFAIWGCFWSCRGTSAFRSFAGRYVLVEGVCQQVEQTAIRKKTKSIYFTTEPYVVKVRLRHRLKEIAVGDHIAVFVSDNMPVYQENGCQILNGYIAIEIKKGSGIHD